MAKTALLKKTERNGGGPAAKAALAGKKAAPPAGAAPATRESFALYRMPGHLIRRLQQVAVSLFFEEVEPAGFDLTPVQFAALRAILHHPGIDQASLAGVIAYDRATIGGVLDRLEAKGLVRRAVSKTDRRVRQLTLQPAGLKLLGIIDPLIARVQDRILDPLEPEEREIFLKILLKLADANNERSRAPLRPLG